MKIHERERRRMLSYSWFVTLISMYVSYLFFTNSYESFIQLFSKKILSFLGFEIDQIELKEKIEDMVNSFLGNRTIYGVLKEDEKMELDGYSLIERRIIESKFGKLNLDDVVEMYHSDDLKSFFEKYEITIKNINQKELWKGKNLFRHYLYYLILEKRIMIYPFDQKENILSFVKEQNILHTYF